MKPNRRPDEIVGPAARPRHRRWYLFRCRLFDVCVHEFLRGDPPGLHDHHAWNVSLVTSGALTEERREGTVILGFSALVFRRATTPHRLTPVGGPATTVFVIGRPRRKWGYWRDGTWIPHDRA
jgi:hypothetical protein